jgi:hypothetical protein
MAAATPLDATLNESARFALAIAPPAVTAGPSPAGTRAPDNQGAIRDPGQPPLRVALNSAHAKLRWSLAPQNNSASQ